MGLTSPESRHPRQRQPYLGQNYPHFLQVDWAQRLRWLARRADRKVAEEYVHLVILADSEFATGVERAN
jgi:hypothetical protein